MSLWLFEKKRGRVVMLFSDPFVAREMVRRIWERFRGRWDGVSTNGGEWKVAAGCPGTALKTEAQHEPGPAAI